MSLQTDSEQVRAAVIDTRPWKVVIHQWPDTDAYACLWAAVRFVVKDGEYEIVCLRAGESLGEEGGCRVLEMDTGLGELDQHLKELKRASSFQLFVEKYRLEGDLALQVIVELTRAADNVERIEPTSIHYLLRGLAYYYRDEDTKEISWKNCFDGAFMAFDIVYSQAKERIKNKKIFEQNCQLLDLENGIKVSNCWFYPGARETAFEAGAEVVVFFNKHKPTGRFYAVIQVHRDSPLKLDRVIAKIRQAEAKNRAVKTEGIDLHAIGTDERFGKWMMHDSHKLVACGTRSHDLVESWEFSTISPTGIFKIVQEVMGSLPRRFGQTAN